MQFSGWQEQYRRMLRTHGRLVQGGFTTTDAYNDALYHMLLDCWHLKEWIKNDPEVAPMLRSNVDKYVRETTALGVVADLANLAKHYLRKKQEAFHDARFSSTVLTINLDVAPIQMQHFATINDPDSGQPVEVHVEEKVMAAVEAWTSYLSPHL